MAIFSRSKKNTDAPAKKKVAPKKAAAAKAAQTHVHAWVLLAPRITEKATEVAARNTYVFDIAVDANKTQVVRAVEELYKVKPRKVAIVNIPQKKIRNPRTGVRGTTASAKKAYVYLNEGDTISLM